MDLARAITLHFIIWLLMYLISNDCLTLVEVSAIFITTIHNTCRSIRMPEWLTMDLPAVVEVGRRIAEQRNASRLGFTTDFSDAENRDLIIASGSLHYFPDPLPTMIGRLRRPPHHVLVNRTPMTDRPDFATTQDAGSYRVACMVYNRAGFIKMFEDIGYRLVGQWEAPELSIDIPFYPKYSVKAYTGMLFSKNDKNKGVAVAA